MPQEDFEEEDLFEDAFGTDEEKVAAKKRLEEKKRNSRVSENKEVVENSSESIKKNNNEGKELGNDDDLEDEDEELEEEDEDKVTEPQLFVDSSGVEFESKDEAFEAMDAGGKKKTNTKNNFESIVDDGLNKSIQNVSSKKNNLKNEGKGYGGKLDLKVSIEDEEEDVEVNSKAHPIERNIIKSVIKNKAVMAAKQEVKLNKVKLSEDKPREEQHDELADALLREEGIKEEVNEIKEKPKSEDDAKPKLPKASILLDEEDEDDSDNKIKPSLDFLFADNGHAYIGRKKSVLAQYGETGGLFVGRVNEKDRQGTDIYLDGLNPHVVFVCGARGSGKCVSGDTLISLSDGSILPISELENNKNNVFGLNDELKIESLQKVGFYERSVDKILHLKLRSGKEIKLTPEHPLLTINGWKQASELPIGERIATPRVINNFGTEDMQECKVKLLAYLIAEGHLGNQFVLFTNSDNKIVSDFTDSVNRFDNNLKLLPHGKYSYRVSQKHKLTDLSKIMRNNKGQFTNEGHIICKKSSLIEWLESLNLYEKRSNNKFIPKEIMKLKREKLALFLNRLFSCDGKIHRINKKTNWQISYCSISKEMSRQVQHLLLRFGVLSKLRTKTTKYGEFKEKQTKVFELVLNGMNVEKFLLEIGFFGEKEKKEEIALNELFNKKNNPNVDTIPKEAWNLLVKKNWTHLGKEIGYKNPRSFHSVINYSPSRRTLQKVALIEQNKTLDLLANSDIFWDEIESVTKVNQETKVYDISVPSFSNFVANDIIVHNSYVLGVVAEELAIKNKNVGIVVVDPIGVFWSMKHPNKEARELEMLAKWDLLPRGLDNVKVFIPVGMKESVPKSTFDAVFSIQPSLLTAEDWCLTFGIDRFSPTGLLMEKGISKVKSGYLKIDGKEVRGKQNTFSLEDLVKCFEDDAELNDRDKGYKADSIRALVSRFDAAKHWGIFDDKGTSLGLLSRAGQMTILDTSFLDDSVSALVVGIFARRILAARKLGTRREAAGKFEEEADITELVELNIPPTWLFIDEAHTLIPGGNQKTPASSALVEYVKQGRRPGCSLVFATQQPSAIDSRVLSQLDVIMAHKLVFDDDIKAIHKRTPTIVPGAYKKSNFIKTLPIGTALTGDRTETTSRAFVMNIRPRMSQHEGRDAETIQTNQELDTDKVEMLAVNIVKRQLEKDPSIRLESVQETIDTLNNTYKKSITLEEILRMLNDNGVIEKEGKLFNKEVLKEIEEEENLVKEQEENEEESESNSTLGDGKGKTKLQRKLSKDVLEFEEELNDIEERVELTALRLSVEEQRARKILAGFAEKKFLFIENEILDRLTLKHAQIYKVRYKYFSHKDAFHEGEAFINSLTGEFIHDDRGNLRESKGLPILLDLNEAETNILKLIAEKKRTAKETAELMRMEEGNAKRVLDTLVKKKLLIKLIDEKKNELYTHGKIEMELPPTPLHEILPSIGKRQITEVDSAIIIQPILSEKEIPELLKKLWGSVIVKEITHLFLPIWEGVLKKRTGEEKIILIDGINGGRINPLQAQ